MQMIVIILAAFLIGMFSGVIGLRVIYHFTALGKMNPGKMFGLIDKGLLYRNRIFVEHKDNIEVKQWLRNNHPVLIGLRERKVN
jgi:hypothetical protein